MEIAKPNTPLLSLGFRDEKCDYSKGLFGWRDGKVERIENSGRIEKI